MTFYNQSDKKPILGITFLFIKKGKEGFLNLPNLVDYTTDADTHTWITL